MTDILFKTDTFLFSYRVAGVLIRDGKVLLQKMPGEPGYAFPGGHAGLGEINPDTLKREFLEEINTDISVGDLLWVGEIFFPWDGRSCHQICLFYQVSLSTEAGIPLDGWFPTVDHLAGREIPLEFHWVPLATLDQILLYPPQAKQALLKSGGSLRHFIFHEEAER